MSEQCDFCLCFVDTAQNRTEHGVTTESRYCDDCFNPDVYYYTSTDQQLGTPDRVNDAGAAIELADLSQRLNVLNECYKDIISERAAELAEEIDILRSRLAVLLRCNKPETKETEPDGKKPEKRERAVRDLRLIASTMQLVSLEADGSISDVCHQLHLNATAIAVAVEKRGLSSARMEIRQRTLPSLCAGVNSYNYLGE
jgi:hypothetical protein